MTTEPDSTGKSTILDMELTVLERSRQLRMGMFQRSSFLFYQSDSFINLLFLLCTMTDSGLLVLRLKQRFSQLKSSMKLACMPMVSIYLANKQFLKGTTLYLDLTSSFSCKGSSILSAIEECAENGFNIVSMSLGGPLPNVFEYLAYSKIAEEKDMILVAAAGNGGNGWVSADC